MTEMARIKIHDFGKRYIPVLHGDETIVHDCTDYFGETVAYKKDGTILYKKDRRGIIVPRSYFHNVSRPSRYAHKITPACVPYIDSYETLHKSIANAESRISLDTPIGTPCFATVMCGCGFCKQVRYFYELRREGDFATGFYGKNVPKQGSWHPYVYKGE